MEERNAWKEGRKKKYDRKEERKVRKGERKEERKTWKLERKKRVKSKGWKGEERTD